MPRAASVLSRLSRAGRAPLQAAPVRADQRPPAPEGRRFLLNLSEPDGLSPADEIVVDWPRLLKK